MIFRCKYHCNKSVGGTVLFLFENQFYWDKKFRGHFVELFRDATNPAAFFRLGHGNGSVYIKPRQRIRTLSLSLSMFIYHHVPFLKKEKKEM